MRECGAFALEVVWVFGHKKLLMIRYLCIACTVDTIVGVLIQLQVSFETLACHSNACLHMLNRSIFALSRAHMYEHVNSP